MDEKRTSWISYANAVFFTLFFVFCSLNIVDAKFSTHMTESELQAYKSGVPGSLPPENLATAPESLRLGLRVELPDSLVENVTKTKAWNKQQNTVSEYAQRLEFVERQNRLWEQWDTKRSLWLSFLSLASIIGLLVFGLLDRKNRGHEAAKETGTHQPEPA